MKSHKTVKSAYRRVLGLKGNLRVDAFGLKLGLEVRGMLCGHRGVVANELAVTFAIPNHQRFVGQSAQGGLFFAPTALVFAFADDLPLC